VPDLNGLFISDHGEQYQDAMITSVNAVINTYKEIPGVYQGASIAEIKQQLEGPVCPETGQPLEQVLADVEQSVLANSLMLESPACVAHLHCPPLIPALAAETLINASNASMDSWDQSPSATLLEEKVCQWLCGLYGYDEGSDAVFTSGGTQSNLMGMLLAREKLLAEHGHSSLSRLRIFCSEMAHFSVQQSAFLLGLRADSVIAIATDEQQRLKVAELSRCIGETSRQGFIPAAVFATAGTTDFGSIDPLVELQALCQSKNLWLHVDAAYGGALMLSERHKDKLAGIASADSITVDFHKMFYQSISCGAFLLKDSDNFRFIGRNADYLNPEEDEQDGIPNLVGKSLQTTRRFDALKLWVSMRNVGRARMEDIINHTLDIACQTAHHLNSSDEFELLVQPAINAVVFRPIGLSEDGMRQKKRQLLLEGKANIATTRYRGELWLKMTLLNPRTKLSDIEKILNAIH